MLGLWRPHRRQRVRGKPRITGVREGTHGTAARGSDPMNHVCDVISAAKDLADLLRYGKKMVERGLVSAHAGNISKRIGNVMLISMRGSMLDELEGKDRRGHAGSPKPPRSFGLLGTPYASSDLSANRGQRRLSQGTDASPSLKSLTTEAAHVNPGRTPKVPISASDSHHRGAIGVPREAWARRCCRSQRTPRRLFGGMEW